MDMSSINSFVVAWQDQIKFFDSDTFKAREEVILPIHLEKDNTREHN